MGPEKKRKDLEIPIKGKAFLAWAMAHTWAKAIGLLDGNATRGPTSNTSRKGQVPAESRTPSWGSAGPGVGSECSICTPGSRQLTQVLEKL